MRVGLVALVACSLLAGCTSGPSGTDFRALALAAPDLLKEDMGADGTLQSMEGTMTMDVTMTMDGRKMPMEVIMDLKQEVFDGGSFLMTMEMRMTGMSDMSMTMYFLCTPEEIRIWSDGMPGEGDMDQRIDNPTGACHSDEDMMRALQGELDPEAEQMLRQMMDQGSFDLSFERIDGDTAVYTMEMDGGQAGMDMSLTLEARAELDGTRIAHMDLSGTMDMDMDEGGMNGSMHMDISGAFDFTYGDRDPLPSKYA